MVMPRPDCDLFRLLHQRAGDSRSAKRRIDGEPMDNDGRLVDVPAHLCVVGLLIHGQRGDSGNFVVNIRDPKLPQVDVALKDRLVRIAVVPLKIACRKHQRERPAA